LAIYLEHRGKPFPDPIPDELQKLETYVKIVLFKAETRYGIVDSSDRLIEAANLVRRIKDEQRKQKKAYLALELRKAEEAHDEETVTRLRGQLSTLIKENKRGG
jgi:hypothetical protein